MKVLFLIASINSPSKGLGGHYHSLKTIATEYNKENEAVVVNIGTHKAKALEGIDVTLYSIINKNISIFSTTKSLQEIILSEKPDVIHSFDRIAYFWGRIMAKKFNLTSVLTKCGGPNEGFQPKSDNLILFSKENLDFFKKSPKHTKTNFFLIPNRVNKFDTDYHKIITLKKALSIDNKTFTFLRITRIGEYYKSSCIQLINLTKKLNEDGINCCAIFIGTVQDQMVLNELKSISNKNIHFVNEDTYTKNAKRLIDIADAVLGTGRSLMEAAAKNKMLLCPSNENIPVLLRKENFEEAFSLNFSERISFHDLNFESNYYEIKNSILNNEAYISNTRFAQSIFEKHFNIRLVPQKLNEVYFTSKKHQKNNIKDFLLHFILIIKTYLK